MATGSIPDIPFIVSAYITQSTPTRTYNNSGNPYNGYNYEFQVDLNVGTISNSTPLLQSDATGITTGMWLLQQSGLAYLIVDLIPTVNPGAITVTLRDVDLYNIYSDPSQSGLNDPLVGSGVGNVIFTISENGLANITYTSC